MDWVQGTTWLQSWRNLIGTGVKDELMFPDLHPKPGLQTMFPSQQARVRCILAPIMMLAMAVGTSLASGSADSKPVPAASKKEAAAPKKPARNPVYVGMPAKELEALIGKPQKIIPVKTPVAKGNHSEVWIYKRLKSSSSESVTIGSKPIMGRRQSGDGTWTDVVLTTEPVEKMRVTDIYEVASFLIVNGRFIATTHTEEKDQHFQ